jgi:protein tyrosine phosphatase (PTP) superfamily phosphohydrolase (DUF442 family)
MLNSAKTMLGFFAVVVEKYTPLSFGGNSLEEPYNYLQISELIATSGQPTEKQFRLMQQAGYKTVINLAPASIIENSLKTESALLQELGIIYIHIPVKFHNPTEDDFQQFATAMQQRTDEKVWVHCAANARVAAFMYRYRATVLGEQKDVIRKDLETIWHPVSVWDTFISKPLG